jgi:hypothetical protein
MSSKRQPPKSRRNLADMAPLGTLFTAVAAATHDGSEFVKLVGIAALVGVGVPLLLHYWWKDK